MNTRSNFDNNLKQLSKMLFEMAKKSERAIKESIDSLIHQDLEKSNQLILEDNLIDEMDLSINEKAILLIAKEAPVAKDLRRIIGALKITSEVERIADNAVNIAKSTLHIGKEKHIKEIVDIPVMVNLALEMFSEALTAFDTEDVELARRCAEKDDQVDEMYGRLVKELLGYIHTYPDKINQITQLSFICRYIERIADHSTNIAEDVIFQVTGKLYDLNA